MKTVRALAAAIFVAVGMPAAWAQMTPVGQWKTVDDKTGQARSEVRITEAGGVLTGHITQLLSKGVDPHAVCDKCSDDRKDKPVVGLEIIRGAKKAEGKDVWEDGKILDAESGKSYTLRMTPIEGGAKMEVRGSIGPFGRTQTWVRLH